MAFLLLGLALLAMKAASFGPVADWSWFVVLAPFGLAVLWWAFADSTGLTQRRAMQKMDKRKADRRDRALAAMGLDAHHHRQVKRARDEARNNRADPTAPPPPLREPEPPRRDPRL